jgi:hypothetical protein
MGALMNYLKADVTKLYVSNSGTVNANFKVSVLSA